LADLQAARSEADLDTAAKPGADDALVRLATVLRSHPVPVAGLYRDSENPASNLDVMADQSPRRRAGRYALPCAAVLFAALLTVMVLRAVANNPPPDALSTGEYSVAAPDPIRRESSPGKLATLHRAVSGHPTDPHRWLTYASALDEAGQLADAERAYRHVLVLKPESVAASQRLSWLLTRSGRASDALTVLGPVIWHRPDDPRVVLLLGLAQRVARRPEATTTLRRYLRLAPHTAQAAMVRVLLGQKR
jgi:cytochrome c-type biogenesis protein CcmH